ncbi:hypothetical protein LEN26_017900 [Aphanomyces euteiches]|nr:hypothetical protein LEN26_017900 [Aphanomyces euteiches]
MASPASMVQLSECETPLGQSTGRVSGTSNWKAHENDALASAYVAVSTDPAVATDQHAGTFWEKVFQHFRSNVPRTTRSASGLQSRWSNPIQKDVNKFVGILSAVLREYHSGWQFGDYVTLAKQMFVEKNNHKQFKFESVYNILKCLPKYSITVDTLDRNVQRALGLDSKADDSIEAHAIVEKRPAVGKKKAKALKFEEELRRQKKPKLSDFSAKPDESLQRIALASESKNVLTKEAMMINFFNMRPDSDEKSLFFDVMAQKYMADMKEAIEIQDADDIVEEASV